MESRVGEKWVTNEGYDVLITEYFNARNCTIQFKSGFILKTVDYGNIKKGTIRNPYHPSVYGVGYIGEGIYLSKVGGKVTKIYHTWNSMLGRCYSSKCQEKQPTYIGCSVDERWHNFQVFAEWFENNYKEGFELDKDILIRDNKVYSPETCCFIPKEINTLLLKRQNGRGNLPLGVSYHKKNNTFIAELSIRGNSMYLGSFKTKEEAFEAYKIAKESHIKKIADKFILCITTRVYQALINYKIEITD